MAVRFRPSDTKRKTYNIIMRFEYGGNLVSLSTGVTCKPEDWDKSRQEVKQKDRHSRRKNNRLTYIKSETEDLYYSFTEKTYRKPNHKYFKEELIKRLNKNKEESETIELPKQTFYDFIKRIIEKRRYMPNFSKGTISGYNTTFNHLKEYCKHKSIILDYNIIDSEFCNSFYSYLIYETDVDSPNSVLKYLKNTRTFLNAAKDAEIITSHKLKIGKSNVKEVRLLKPYLTQEDIDKLFRCNLSGARDKLRDLLISARHTGLRFQDWHKPSLTRVNVIKGKEFITLPTQKTSQTVSIPLHPQLKKVLEKYNGKLPKPSSNQKTNDLIKMVCKDAGITQKQYKTGFENGKIVEYETEKYNLISTHAMRRTAATLLYLDEIPVEVISHIIGHIKKDGTPNVEQTRKYISATGVDIALMISNSFNRK